MRKFGPNSRKVPSIELERGQEPVPLPGGISPDREIPELWEGKNQDSGVIWNYRHGPGDRGERVVVDED